MREATPKTQSSSPASRLAQHPAGGSPLRWPGPPRPTSLTSTSPRRERWEGVLLNEAEACDVLDQLGFEEAAAKTAGHIITQVRNAKKRAAMTNSPEVPHLPAT